MSITHQIVLKARAESGEKEAFLELFDELQRLESIIKDYEIEIEMIVGRFNDNRNKLPKKI
jgi:hypothetical protein